jgi:uncharacterized protein (DUF1778 family)
MKSKQEQQVEDKKEGINLAIRLSGEQYEKLKVAAEKSGKQVSTWIREVSLTTAGDTRPLEELLKAVCTYIEE